MVETGLANPANLVLHAQTLQTTACRYTRQTPASSLPLWPESFQARHILI